jgi:hypothetical protein
MNRSQNSALSYGRDIVPALNNKFWDSFMNQDQQPRPWWKDNRFAWALGALVLTDLAIITILGYCQKRTLWRPTL